MRRTDVEFNLNLEVIDPINLTAAATWVVAGQSSVHPCSGGCRPGIFFDGPLNAAVCIRWVLDRRSGGSRFYWIKQSPPHRVPIIVICIDQFWRYFWRRFSRILVPRYILQYPPTPLSPMCVCINVIYPCQMSSHSETLRRVLMSACQGNGKGQPGDGGRRRERPGGYGVDAGRLHILLSITPLSSTPAPRLTQQQQQHACHLVESGYGRATSARLPACRI